LWDVALMLIMYTSAIFYDAASLKENQWIFNYNPIYHIIVNFRNCIYGHPLDMRALWISMAYSFISLFIGVIVFYKKQDKFILNI